MKKYINIKKVYLFTFISFITTLLFLYIFTKTAEKFYTGWDNYTNTNALSMLANAIFILLLVVNLISITLSIIYTFKILLNKLSRKEY